MSEQELNSYRFLSGEDPTDEMLECIMKEAAKDAVARKKVADERMKAEMNKMRQVLHAEFSERINRLRNAQ